MTTPQPVADVLARLTAAMPAEVRERLRCGPAVDLAELYAVADRAALAEQADRRRSLRNADYARRRPPEYAAASYAGLMTQQNPGGKVSAWLASGRTNLLLMGPSWHGKSTSAYAIGNDAAAGGLWVEAWFAPELADRLGPAPRNRWDDVAYAESVESAARRAADCDLLILDDLGREDTREGLLERWRAALLRILNERAGDSRRRTIVTGNSTDRAGVPRRITDRYGTPVLNRLLMDAECLWVEGQPFRQRHGDLFGSS